MEPEQKAEILLVDDRPENLVALEAMLAGPGRNLVKANSGQEALMRCLEQDFAVILMDVKMPGMDGIETATMIRQREKSRYTPILLVTAMDKDEAQVLKGYSLGVVDFIFKPIAPEILKAKVSQFVDLFNKTVEIKNQAVLLREGEEQERALAQELAQAKAAQEQLQRDLRRLEEMPGSPHSSATARAYGNLPIRESASPIFNKLVGQYGNLLDLALEQRTHKVDHGISATLAAMAEELGFLKGGPRDAVEVHTLAMKAKVAGLPPVKAQAYLEEGRLVVLELMGHLVSFYRKYYVGTSSDSMAMTTQEKTKN